MNCCNCGYTINKGSKLCPHCGKKQKDIKPLTHSYKEDVEELKLGMQRLNLTSSLDDTTFEDEFKRLSLKLGMKFQICTGVAKVMLHHIKDETLLGAEIRQKLKIQTGRGINTL